MYFITPTGCRSHYCLTCGPIKALSKRDWLRKILKYFPSLLHVTLTFDPDKFDSAFAAYQSFQQSGISRLKQRLHAENCHVGHYFGAVHFRPIPEHIDWFHVHVILDCDAIHSQISANWPHGVTIPGKPGISSKVAADYAMHYATNPEYGWPDWFRQNRFKRFYNSQQINSVDPRHVPKRRITVRKVYPRFSLPRKRRSVDDQIASCGRGATIQVERPGQRGYETIALRIGELSDRDLVEQVLNGKKQFFPADLLNADLGMSPEQHYRNVTGWELPNLPADYLQSVPRHVIDNWNTRRNIVIALSRLISREDWLAAGYSHNPIDPDSIIAA